MRLKKILKKFVAETLAVVIALGCFAMVPVFADTIELEPEVTAKLTAEGIPTIGEGTDYFVNQPITVTGYTELTLGETVDYAAVDVTLEAFEGENTQGEQVVGGVIKPELNGEKFKVSFEEDNFQKLPEYTPKGVGNVTFKLSASFKDQNYEEIACFNDVEVSNPISVKNYVTFLEPDASAIITTVNTDTSFKFTVKNGLEKLKSDGTNYSSKIALYDENGNKLSDEQNFALDSSNNLTATVNCKFYEVGDYTLTPKVQDNYEGAKLYSFDSINITVSEQQESPYIDENSTTLKAPEKESYISGQQGYFVGVPMQLSAAKSDADASKKIVIKGTQEQLSNINNNSYAEVFLIADNENPEQPSKELDLRCCDIEKSTDGKTVTIDCGTDVTFDNETKYIASKAWNITSDSTIEDSKLTYKVKLIPSISSEEAIDVSGPTNPLKSDFEVVNQVTNVDVSIDTNEVKKVDENANATITINDGWKGLIYTDKNPIKVIATEGYREIANSPFELNDNNELEANCTLFGDGVTVKDAGTHEFNFEIFDDSENSISDVRNGTVRVNIPNIKMYSENEEVINYALHSGQKVKFKVEDLPDDCELNEMWVENSEGSKLVKTNEEILEYIAEKPGNYVVKADFSNEEYEPIQFEFKVVDINKFELDKYNVATGASTGVTAILDTNGNKMTNDELIGNTFKLVAVPLDSNGNENWNGNWTIAVDTFTFTTELEYNDLANIIRYYPREEGRYRLHLNVQYKDQVGTGQYIDFTQNINCIKNAHHGTDWEYTGINVNSISAAGDIINIEPVVISYYPQDENNMDYKYIVKPGKENEGWEGWYVAKPFTTGLNNYDLKLNPGTYTIYIDVKDAFGNVVTQHQEITITEANGAYWCYAGILTGSPVAGSGGNIYITTTPQVVCSDEDVKLQYKYVVKPGRKNDGWEGWYVAQELGDNDSCDIEIKEYKETYTIYVDVVDSESKKVTQSTEVYLNY